MSVQTPSWRFSVSLLLIVAVHYAAVAEADQLTGDEKPSITAFRASLFSPRDNAIQELSRRGLHFVLEKKR